MIRLAAPTPPLDARQQFALDVLLDLSRLLRVEDPSASAVSVGVGSRATAMDVTLLATLSGASSAFENVGGAVTIDRGLLDAVASVAGAVDEQLGAPLDRHGRVPANA